MDHPSTHPADRILLTRGGPALAVRPESFAEFDFWMSRQLDELEHRWSDVAPPSSRRLSLAIREDFYRPGQPR